MNPKAISHSGIVVSVEKGCVHVKIIQSSACASCKVASHCLSSESKEKVVDVYTPDYSKYSVGEEVSVLASSGVGFKAVLYAFVIPTLFIFAAIIVALNLGVSEPLAALTGMGTLVLWYIIIYMMRGYFDKVLTFTIGITNNINNN